MGLKELSLSGALAVMLSVTPAFSETISGSLGAGFQSWTTNNLDENGSPYWDNSSMDGSNRNVGFYLVNAPTAPLPGAPGNLPYWGNSGSADSNFFFQNSAASITAVLELEVAAFSNVNEFGWYNINDPTDLHPLFLGPDAPLKTNTFSPGTSYGFYIMSGSTDNMYFTQSSLNSGGDTGHQHFVIFQDPPAQGPEGYWIGVEDLSVSKLDGNEGQAGDYNDMLIHITAFAVPEPSTAMLVLSASLLMISVARRHPLRRDGQMSPRRRGTRLTREAS